jgi:hypothetical protein
MALRDRLLGFAGVAIAGGATLWALAGGTAAPVGTLVAVGVVFAIADAAVWRAASDDASDLDIPPGRRLPPPPWGALIAVAAGLGVIGALVVRAVPVAVAVAVVGVTAVVGSLRRRDDAVLPVRTVQTARRLRAFVRAHGVEKGNPAEGYLTPLGEPGSRLLVVAPDGAWADAMLGGDATTVTGLARITLREPGDPATGQKVRIGPGLWTRMTDSW